MFLFPSRVDRLFNEFDSGIRTNIAINKHWFICHRRERIKIMRFVTRKTRLMTSWLNFMNKIYVLGHFIETVNEKLIRFGDCHLIAKSWLHPAIISFSTNYCSVDWAIKSSSWTMSDAKSLEKYQFSTFRDFFSFHNSSWNKVSNLPRATLVTPRQTLMEIFSFSYHYREFFGDNFSFFETISNVISL